MILPKLDTICKFNFTPRFTTLNGFYRLTQINTYDEILEMGINLYELLYAPLSLSTEDFNIDYVTYRDEPILKLIEANADLNGNPDPTIVYAPKSILGLSPDPMVVQCRDLVLHIAMGHHTKEDADALDWFVDHVNEEASAITGLTTSAIWGEGDARYESAADYADYKADREQAVVQLDTLPLIIKKQDETIARLKTKIAYLEAHLIAVGSLPSVP